MTSTRRKIASNIIFLGGSQGITWLLTSVYVLVIPRYIGPEGMGLLTLLFGVVAVVYVIANAGTRMYILREVARHPEEAQKLVGPALILNTLLAVLCWAVVIGVMTALNESETARLITYIFAVSSVLSLTVSPLQATLQGMEKMHYSFVESIIQKVIGTALALTWAALNFGLVMIAFTEIITIIPVALLNIWWFRKQARTRFKAKLEDYKFLVRSGFAFLIVEISFNIYLYLDSFLLASFTSEKIVGYYGVPTRFFGTLMVIPVVVSRAILPALSRMAVSTQDAMLDMSRKTLSFLMCVSLPVAVGSTVMAQPIIDFFYKSEFEPSVPIMIFLGWTVVPTYLGIGLYQILTAMDKQVGWTKLMVIAIFVNLGLNSLLIPYFQSTQANGGIGAAIGLLVTEIIIGIFGCRLVGRDVINFQLLVSVLKSLAAALLMGALIWPLRDAPLFVPIIAGMLIYGGLVVAFGLVPLAYLKVVFGLAGRLKQRIIAR